MPFQQTPSKRQHTDYTSASSSSNGQTLTDFSIWMRFCVAPNCNAVFPNGLTSGREHCPTCKSCIPPQSLLSGTWTRCDKCKVYNECTFARCYLCGEKNLDYDPEKPRRLEDAKIKKQHLMCKKEAREEIHQEQLSEIQALKAENEELREQLAVKKNHDSNLAPDEQEHSGKIIDQQEGAEPDKRGNVHGEEKPEEEEEEDKDFDWSKAYDQVMSSQETDQKHSNSD